MSIDPESTFMLPEEDIILSAAFSTGDEPPASIYRIAPPRWYGGINRDLNLYQGLVKAIPLWEPSGKKLREYVRDANYDIGSGGSFAITEVAPAFNVSSGLDIQTTFPDTQSYDALGDFTISLWMRPAIDVVSTTNPMPWAYELVERFSGSNIDIYMGFAGSPAHSCITVSFVLDFGLSVTFASHAGRWYHVVLTRLNNVGTIYVNGLNVRTGTVGNTKLNQAITTLGNSSIRLGASAASAWQGHLSNYLLWNRALTAGEVSKIYREPWTLYRKPAYVAYYDNLWIDGVGGAVGGGAATVTHATIDIASGGAIGGGSASFGGVDTFITTGVGVLGGGAAVSMVTYNPTTTGNGAVGGGQIDQFDIDQPTTTGVGAIGGGADITMAVYNPTTTGNGAVGGGTGSGADTYTITTTGVGLLGGGTADSSHLVIPPITATGVLGGGAASPQLSYGPVVNGAGGIGGGADVEVATYNPTITGNGGVGGGHAIDSTTIGMSGGSIAGSNTSAPAFADYNTGSTLGGVIVAGAAQAGFTFNFVASGGFIASGITGHSVGVIMLGGATGDGSADVNLGVAVVTGTLFAGGSGDIQTTYFIDPEGGTSNDGSAPNSKQHIFVYASSGGPVLKSNFKYGIRSLKYRATGSVVVGGSTSVVNYSVFRNFQFLWDIKTVISRDLSFLWNVGQLPIFWYRIIGKGTQNTACPLDACCQRYVLNMHARTLGELCEKLSKRNYNFAIESVQQFSQPAEPSVLAASVAAGLDPNCNTLLPVNICSIPQCAQFCIQEDFALQLRFNMTVQVNAFDFYVGSGSAFLTGSAGANFTIVRPSFSAQAAGSISVNGGAEIQTDSYSGVGGGSLGGSADTEMSRWNYIAGFWPASTNVGHAQVVETIAEHEPEQPWSLIERALLDDGLYASCDVSFGQNSELLVLRDFNLQVPDWAELMGLYVRVDRLATHIGIRDVEVFLVYGDEIISDNLADIANDWPLISTTKIYGSNGVNGGGSGWRTPPYDGFPEDLTTALVNDPQFGVAIRVTARTSLAATIAKIDFIGVQAVYDNPNGSVVRMGGEATSRGPTYYYQASGVVLPNDSSIARLGYRYRSNGLGGNAAPELQPTGHAPITYSETGSGSGLLGGEANVVPYFEYGSGGARLDASAIVEPFLEIGSGGASLTASGFVSHVMSYVASGGSELDGSAFSPLAIFRQTASGAATLTGIAPVKSTHWGYKMSGPVVVDGSAGQKASTISTPVQGIEFGMVILQTDAQFSSDVDLQNLVLPTKTVNNRCECVALPLSLELTQNINRDNVLSQFLARNRLSMSSTQVLRYNTVNDSWQANLHYRGRSADANSLETWRMTFEVQCTSLIGGINIGRNLWKIAFLATRLNETTGEEFATRVMLGVLPDNTCGVTGDHLDLRITYNTLLNFSVVDVNATIYQNTLFDNIGLFKNPAWTVAPDLAITVSRAAPRPVTRVDLTDSVLI